MVQGVNRQDLTRNESVNREYRSGRAQKKEILDGDGFGMEEIITE